MEATAPRISADEYFELEAAGQFRDRSVELVDGVLTVNQPRLRHGALVVNIATELRRWIQAGGGRGLAALGTDVEMNEFNVFGPDVLWIAEGHRPADLDARLVRGPDLCVEVRSPSTWHFDVGQKKRVYEAGGLPELWLVDTVAQSVLVFRRSAAGTSHFDVALELERGETLRSPQLPGFALALDVLFRI